MDVITNQTSVSPKGGSGARRPRTGNEVGLGPRSSPITFIRMNEAIWAGGIPLPNGFQSRRVHDHGREEAKEGHLSTHFLYSRLQKRGTHAWVSALHEV